MRQETESLLDAIEEAIEARKAFREAVERFNIVSWDDAYERLDRGRQEATDRLEAALDEWLFYAQKK